jgi:hypothetical protein
MNWQNTILHPFDVETATNDQIAVCIRAWRNRQLALSDWTQLSDAPVNKSAWATYRQELRDMMQQTNDPKVIVFPVPPQ